ncbi:hypothetical protein CVT24_001418, partial [Panaeolus cyanescens]
ELVGLSDLECPERAWGPHNAVGIISKASGPGAREDIITDHFAWWNWLKIIGMGTTMLRKHRNAVADRNVQKEAHTGLTATLKKGLVKKWEAACLEWEAADYPKDNVANPYDCPTEELTEANVRAELAKNEEKRLASGETAQATGPSSFIAMGLDLEDTQRRLKRLAKITPLDGTRREGGLVEQRNQLRTRIRQWELLLPIYMPGLLQYRSKTMSDDTSSSPNPEDNRLWLPSNLPADLRDSICSDKTLAAIEEKLRTAQCSDALNLLRHILTIKTRLIKFKEKNITGQRDGTRSRAIIDRVHERARAAALKYRAAREAKLRLSGPGEWEQVFRVLADSDIRGYQDPEKGRGKNRPGGVQTEDFSLVDRERTRREGTGETRRVLSWIWTTARSEHEKDDESGVLQSEWSKSRARVARATEEVELLKEEMRRSLISLEHKAAWWKDLIGKREVDDGPLSEGLTAHANKQADIQQGLRNKFKGMWEKPLNTMDKEEEKEEDSDDSDTDDENVGDIVEDPEETWDS